MHQDDQIKAAEQEPVILPGPAPYEEELKDYSTLPGELPADQPMVHPEPKPSKK